MFCRYDLEANPVTEDHIRGARSRGLARHGRVPAIAAGWAGLVVIATSVLWWQAGSAQPTGNDVVAFALSMTLAGTVAAAVAFAVAGRWRWAIDTVFSVILVGLVITVLLVYFVWIDIRFVRGQMGSRQFDYIQRMTQFWAIQFAGFVAPLGEGVGVVAGMIAGVLIRLAQRMPRVGPAIAVCLLVAWAAGAARGFGAGLLTPWGWRESYYLVPWSSPSDEIAKSAMLFGAILGAVVAGTLLHLAIRSHHATVMRNSSLAADGSRS
jgi:hypothetical protein